MKAFEVIARSSQTRWKSLGARQRNPLILQRKEKLHVVRAYIHIRVEPGKVPDVVKQLKAIPEVKEVHSVTGPYDVIAKVEVADTKALTDFLITRIHKISGIRDTMTSIILD